MCEDCYSAVCLEGCPYLRDRLARKDCEICGEPIREGDRYYRHGAHCVCADCTELLTLEELLYLSDLEEVGELLALLGFRHYN